MVSVLLATTGRPEKVKAFVESLVATTAGHDIELVVAVDACPETQAYLAMTTGLRKVIVDWRDEYRGSSKAWNDALSLSTGDPVVLAADDLEWQQGWLEASLACLEEFPDGWGLVGFNDGHWGPELSTHYLMSRRFVIEVLGGVVAWDYEHSFTDCEANERARRAGRYAWCEDAHVHHAHWLFGDRHRDGTDTRLLSSHPAAERRFLERQAAGFPNDMKPVITC